MALEEIIRGIWEQERPEGRTAPLRAALNLLSMPYRCAAAARNRLYDKGALRQERLPCPVISVGNLTVGGTGKTPIVILLANALRNRGRRPAVLSRGYGGNAKAPVNIVADGTRVLMDWREVGDEPVLIARSAEGTPVLTGPRRVLTGRTALEKFGADCLILDDAFQHRALYRDLDILLIDAARPFGNGFLLPRGPLRENPNAIGRAHLVIGTGGDVQDPDHAGQEAPFLPAFRGSHRPTALVEADSGRMLPLSEIRGQRVCAFAGIGRPDSFRRSLTDLGAQIISFLPYPDHHPYTRSDLDHIRRLNAQSGAARIVTTEKDGVRLADFPESLPGLLFLRIGMEITPAEPFTELIFSRLAY
jgi:tetraacyldisaccharide 4'-kinase